jgi:hypothetical protein
LSAAIPVLLALGQRQRGRQAAARHLARVAAGPAATLEALAEPGDRGLRLWALAALAARGLLAGARGAAALLGLDDEHDETLPATAIPFLAHPSPAVRRAAVQAVGRHASTDDIVGYLTPLLPDASAKVAATALRHLRDYDLPDSVLDRLDAAGTPRCRMTALSIRRRSGTWNRIRADLTAMKGNSLRSRHPDDYSPKSLGPAPLASSWPSCCPARCSPRHRNAGLAASAHHGAAGDCAPRRHLREQLPARGRRGPRKPGVAQHQLYARQHLRLAA